MVGVGEEGLLLKPAWGHQMHPQAPPLPRLQPTQADGATGSEVEQEIAGRSASCVGSPKDRGEVSRITNPARTTTITGTASVVGPTPSHPKATPQPAAAAAAGGGAAAAARRPLSATSRGRCCVVCMYMYVGAFVEMVESI